MPNFVLVPYFRFLFFILPLSLFLFFKIDLIYIWPLLQMHQENIFGFPKLKETIKDLHYASFIVSGFVNFQLLITSSVLPYLDSNFCIKKIIFNLKNNHIKHWEKI